MNRFSGSTDIAIRPSAASSAGGRWNSKRVACDRSAAEAELMQAMQDYKQSSGRMFPTWSEVLQVAQGLGYQKGSL